MLKIDLSFVPFSIGTCTGKDVGNVEVCKTTKLELGTTSDGRYHAENKHVKNDVWERLILICIPDFVWRVLFLFCFDLI